jgi:D-lactate dehydrogenase
MKKGVIFINTARGKVVNTEDLIDALQNKMFMLPFGCL